MSIHLKALFGGLALALVLLSSGCANKERQYYWGNYENLIYAMYANPGEADPGTQIQMLTTTIERAANYNAKIPPGIHAHLGFMYALQGNIEQAQAAFNTEKAQYPESKVLIEGMMNRAFNKVKK